MSTFAITEQNMQIWRQHKYRQFKYNACKKKINKSSAFVTGPIIAKKVES